MQAGADLSGSRERISVDALAQILGRGKRVAMESPTYKQAYRVLGGAGYPVIPVSMDSRGMEVKGLEESGADIAYVMPSHQYPTGIVMPVKRRQEILAWADGGTGRYVIEDDYDSEFRYKGKPIPALQGMDQRGRVIYMGTFSKSIAPAIRCGDLWYCRNSCLQHIGKKQAFTFPLFPGSTRRCSANFLQKAITNAI